MPEWAGRRSEPQTERPSAPTADAAGAGTDGRPRRSARQPDPVLRRGMSGYLLAFEIISIHLVVVLVGAAYLARAKRRVESSRRPRTTSARDVGRRPGLTPEH